MIVRVLVFAGDPLLIGNFGALGFGFAQADCASSGSVNMQNGTNGSRIARMATVHIVPDYPQADRP